MPRSGLLREGTQSVTVTRRDSVSPGRTGLIHRISSIPGDPRLAVSLMTPSQNSRMASDPVCQPLAMRPPKTVCRAASSSTWKTWGSNCAAEGDDLVLGEGVPAQIGHLARP